VTDPTSALGDQLRGLAEGLTGFLGTVTAELGEDHSAECRTCPLCTALAVLRGQRPDLSDALADLLSTAATALRGLARPAPGDAPPAADDAAPEPEPAHRPAPVQHIEVA
jgi:hypothetical protein